MGIVIMRRGHSLIMVSEVICEFILSLYWRSSSLPLEFLRTTDFCHRQAKHGVVADGEDFCIEEHALSLASCPAL